MPSSPGRVLVVEDEPEVGAMLLEVLVQLGYTVELADRGAGALQHVPVFEPDVVLLDLTMPGSRGDETYRDVRAIRADIPIILMSGYSHQEASTLFEGEDLAGFLQKPFRLERLRELVRAATSRASDQVMTAR